MNSSLAKTGLKALLSKKSLPPKKLRLVSLRLLLNLALTSTAHPFLKLKIAKPTIKSHLRLRKSVSLRTRTLKPLPANSILKSEQKVMRKPQIKRRLPQPVHLCLSVHMPEPAYLLKKSIVEDVMNTMHASRLIEKLPWSDMKIRELKISLPERPLWLLLRRPELIGILNVKDAEPLMKSVKKLRDRLPLNKEKSMRPLSRHVMRKFKLVSKLTEMQLRREDLSGRPTVSNVDKTTSLALKLIELRQKGVELMPSLLPKPRERKSMQGWLLTEKLPLLPL
jgi:hypothetical protein